MDSTILNCIGPCSEINFILSSCEDDYDIENNLDYPAALCKSVCSPDCDFVIALFETNGKLVNPNDYSIRWSNGASGSAVMLKQPYYNNLNVEVRKGECVWYGRYWKSCTNYHKQSIHNTLESRSIHFTNSELQDLYNSKNHFAIYNSLGTLVSSNNFKVMYLPNGIYFLNVEKNGRSNFKRIMIIN